METCGKNGITQLSSKKHNVAGNSLDPILDRYGKMVPFSRLRSEVSHIGMLRNDSRLRLFGFGARIAVPKGLGFEAEYNIDSWYGPPRR